MKKSIYLIILILLGINQLYPQTNDLTIHDFFKKLYAKDRSKIATLFSKSFLNKVPETQINKILDTFHEQFGSFEKVLVKEEGKLEVIYEKATMPGHIGFDSEGKVNTLWFGAPKMKTDSWDNIKSELQALKGDVSLCIRKDGKEIFELNKDKKLGVGSTFKLFVLKTLVDKINSGQATWDKVVKLNGNYRSLPSGMIQAWKDNEPVTLSTLANLMISISDNTATDNLIGFVGSETIEKKFPQVTPPFYMTNEMFRLKLGKDSAYVEEYIRKPLSEKRNIIASLKSISIDSLDVSRFSKPVFIDIEWFVSSQELCKVIESLEGVPAISINKGLVTGDDWQYAGYKGGSEPGVLNYTHLLRKSTDAPLYSISATINNKTDNVDVDKEFTLLVTRMISMLLK